MGPEQMININVIIADRPYRLKIKPAEEENVRKAAKLINEKVKDFQNVYEAKDKQDYLAMAALMYAVDSVNLKTKSSSSSEELELRLDEIDAILTGFLNK